MIICKYRKKGERDGEDPHIKECHQASEWQSLLAQQRSGHVRIVSIRNVIDPGKKEIAKDGPVQT